MYYRLVSLAGLSALAEVVSEEPVAPWQPCPRELTELALPCPALPGAALAGLGCRPCPGLDGSQSPVLLKHRTADGKVVILTLRCV